ncbi:hypothetical protein B0H14DRAFT_2598614 [Mycena olivaceomarginata]|nr:hypothetical protein B0H14DRAFT_2598614 [Mycena olivaceomarginata]
MQQLPVSVKPTSRHRFTYLILCFPVTAHIYAYLSGLSVRETLGVNDAVPTNFSSCGPPSTRPSMRRWTCSASPKNTSAAGLCNWLEIERWALGLKWPGQADFAAEPLRPWAVEDDFTKAWHTAPTARCSSRLIKQGIWFL